MGKEIFLSHENEETIKPREQREFESFLINKNWVAYTCPHCTNEYFAKERSTTASCGSYNCAGYEFLNRPRKKGYIDTDKIGERLISDFGSQSYKKTEPISVINTIGNNLFTGAGGYFNNPVIFNEAPIQETPIIINQPVIRLKEKELVGQTDGISTSFINISTEQVNPSMAEHIVNFDKWLQQLSSLGLFMGDFSLKIATDKPKWAETVILDAVIVKINYLGLEIGVANYFTNIPQRDRPALTLSDMSFGLERIAWALNKLPSYYDILGPINYSARGEHKLMDDYRTMTLMAAYGVLPLNKDRGSKFRMLTKDCVRLSRILHLDLVSYYHDWWNQFADLPLKKSDVMDIIGQEFNRNINVEIRRITEATENIPLNISQDEYSRRLLRTGKSIDEIKNLLRGK